MMFHVELEGGVVENRQMFFDGFSVASPGCLVRFTNEVTTPYHEVALESWPLINATLVLVGCQVAQGDPDLALELQKAAQCL